MARTISGTSLPTSYREIRSMLNDSFDPLQLARESLRSTRTPELLVVILQHQGRTIRVEFHPQSPWQLSVSAGPVMLQDVQLPDGALVEALLAVQRTYTILRNVSEDNTP